MGDNSIPVINLSRLAADPDALKTVASELGAACRNIGFFYITGHGLSAGLRERVFQQAATFFADADSAKRKLLYSAETGNRGFVPMKGESLDPTQPADLKEAFNIGLELPVHDPELLAKARFRAPNQWPDTPGFQQTMLQYFDEVWAIGRLLHRAFAIDLGINENYFEDKLDRPLATLRLLHYPPQPDRMEPGQLGAGAHTDYGCVTLLATDEVGGLEVRTRSGTWLKAPFVADAFVCNIGDCLMRWTNDVYVSTPHRVVSPAGRERYSVAFFLDPNPDAVVAPLPGMEKVALYPPITGADYLQSRLDATYKLA
jgi:isopenicillin N synthase-like dioxygenase